MEAPVIVMYLRLSFGAASMRILLLLLQVSGFLTLAAPVCADSRERTHGPPAAQSLAAAQRPEDADDEALRKAREYYDKATDAWSRYKTEEAQIWLERALEHMPYNEQIRDFYKTVKSRNMRHKSLTYITLGQPKEAQKFAIEGLAVDDTEPVIIRNLRRAEAIMKARSIPYERFSLPEEVERCHATYEANVEKCEIAFCDHNQMKLYEMCVGRPVGSTEVP